MKARVRDQFLSVRRLIFKKHTKITKTKEVYIYLTEPMLPLYKILIWLLPQQKLFLTGVYA